MRYLRFFPLAFLVACGSSDSTESNKAQRDRLEQQGKGVARKKYDTPVVTVEHIDKKGKTLSKTDEAEMQVYHRRVKTYEGKTSQELTRLMKDGNATERTIIIETVFHRGMDYYKQSMLKQKGALTAESPDDIEDLIKVLAIALDDKQSAVLEKEDTTLWMESKTVYEKPDVRIYAAYTIQRISDNEITPDGYKFIKHRSGLIYCVKNEFSQVKDDVAKAWVKWRDKSL
jgi:hypothetical protein